MGSFSACVTELLGKSNISKTGNQHHFCIVHGCLVELVALVAEFTEGQSLRTVIASTMSMSSSTF